jgi:hypothetical protein
MKLLVFGLLLVGTCFGQPVKAGWCNEHCDSSVVVGTFGYPEDVVHPITATPAKPKPAWRRVAKRAGPELPPEPDAILSLSQGDGDGSWTGVNDIREQLTHFFYNHPTLALWLLRFAGLCKVLSISGLLLLAFYIIARKTGYIFDGGNSFAFLQKGRNSMFAFNFSEGTPFVLPAPNVCPTCGQQSFSTGCTNPFHNATRLPVPV